MTVHIGDSAPHFTLKDQHNIEHSLESYRGQWVFLYFYPKDNTPGCTTEACAIRDIWHEFEDAHVAVLGISKDSTESHKKFEEDHKLPFTLLSDPDKKVLKKYGALRGAVTRRMSYLISPHGTIARIYPKVKPEDHAEEVIRDLKEVGEVALPQMKKEK